MRLNEFSTVGGPKGPKDYGQPNSSRYIGGAKFVVGTTHNYILTATVEKWGLEWDEDDEIWFLDSPGAAHIADATEGEIELPPPREQRHQIHDLVTDYLNEHNSSDLQKVAAYYGHSPDGEMATEGVRVANQQIPGTKNRAKSAYYPTNVPPKVKKLDKPLTDKELSRLTNQGVKEGNLNEFDPGSNNDGGGENDRNRRIRKLLEIAIQVAKEKNVDELGMIHAMNMIAGDDFFSVAVEGILPDITDKEYMFVLQSAYKTVKQGVAEAMTPPGEFLSKAERVKAGDKVLYKGKVVGIATGEINDNKIIFKPNQNYGNNTTASLPIDEISLREGRHNPLDPYQRDQANSTSGIDRPEDHKDDERHDLDPVLIYALKINGKIWKKYGETVTFFTKERALSARNSILAKSPELEITLLQREKD